MRFLTDIRKLMQWKAAVGLSAAMKWAFLHIAVRQLRLFPEPASWRVRPRQVLHPLTARLRGSSDMEVFDQIFLCEEYSCLLDLPQPSLIVDLGSNVGFSAAYFLSAFPKANIVAVEPDTGNFAICETNLSPYGDRALLMNGAAWSKRATLRFVNTSFGDGREWATQVGEPIAEGQTSDGITAWDVGSLIDMSGRDSVDLLKVDIERAELSVFGDSADSWLHRVRNICIELHGKDCKEVFFAALQNFDYDLGHSGELTICRNLRLRELPKIKADSPSTAA